MNTRHDRAEALLASLHALPLKTVSVALYNVGNRVIALQRFDNGGFELYANCPFLSLDQVKAWLKEESQK